MDYIPPQEPLNTDEKWGKDPQWRWWEKLVIAAVGFFVLLGVLVYIYW